MCAYFSITKKLSSYVLLNRNLYFAYLFSLHWLFFTQTRGAVFFLVAVIVLLLFDHDEKVGLMTESEGTWFQFVLLTIRLNHLNQKQIAQMVYFAG